MNQYTIAVAGLSADQLAALRTALKISAPDWTFVDGLQADLLLVDIDSPSSTLYSRCAALGEERLVALLSDQDVAGDCSLFLEKPIYSNRLKYLLDTSCTYMIDPVEGSFATAMAILAARVTANNPVAAETDMTACPPVTITSTDAVAENPATPGDAGNLPADEAEAEPLSVGACLLAGTIHSPLQLRSGDIELLLDPEHDAYQSTTLLKPLRTLLDMPMPAAQTCAADAIADRQDTVTQPLSRLKWLAALCAAQGPSPLAADPQTAYRLTRWPQIEREFPHHFSIAKAMLKQPGSVQEIAAAASTELGEVAAFIHAYEVTGHVVSHSTPTGSDATAPASRGFANNWRLPFSRAARAGIAAKTKLARKAAQALQQAQVGRMRSAGASQVAIDLSNAPPSETLAS